MWQVYEGLGEQNTGVAFARDPDAERMLLERGFRDVDPESLRVATKPARMPFDMEQDEDAVALTTSIVTSGVDGLVVEDSLVLSSLDSLYQV